MLTYPYYFILKWIYESCGRWKKKAIDDNKQGFSYGLKSSKSPLQVKDLI